MEREKFQGVYPYYGAAKVLDFVQDYIFDGKYLLMAEDGSVITTKGYPVLQFVNEKFWANNHTHILEGRSPVTTEFLYLTLNKLPISGYITGAAQPKITQENLNRIPVVVPTDSLLISFDEIVKDLFDNINVLGNKNSTLRRTRDLLLPKLISGAIDVSEFPETSELTTA